MIVPEPASPSSRAVALSSVVATGLTVAALQTAVPWHGSRTEFLILATVCGAVAAMSAWFFHLRWRTLRDPMDQHVRNIFVPILFHFCLRIGLEPFHPSPDVLATVVRSSWVVTQVSAALILLLTFQRSYGFEDRRHRVARAVTSVALAVLAGAACWLATGKGFVEGPNPVGVGLTTLYLLAAAVPLFRPGTVQPRREVWLGAMLLLVAVAHADLAWSERPYDTPFMWGHVVIALSLLAPLVGAIRENVTLVESQTALTARVRTFRQRVEALLDSLPSLVLSVDRDLVLRYSNRAASDLFGLPHGLSPEGGGRVWLDRLHDSDRQLVTDTIPTLIDSGDGDWTGVVQAFDLDGAAHWLNLSLHPLVDPVENRPLVEVVATDVTDLQLARRTSEVRQSRLAFLSNVGQTVAGELAVERVLDRFLHLGREVYPMVSLLLFRPSLDHSSLRLVAATGRGLEILNGPTRRPVEASRHPCWMAFQDGFPRLSSTLEAGFDDDEAAALEQQGIRQLLFVPLLAAGSVVGVLGTAVSESAALGSDDVDLLTQVGILLGGAVHLSELVRELGEQRAVAIETSRLKSEFLANTSHELRTPLTAILGFLRLLIDGSVDDSDKQKDFLRIAHESAEKLLNIINDVLDLAKIEAGRLEVHRSPVPVRHIFGDVDVLFRHQMKGRGVGFTIDTPPPPAVLWADADRTLQILVNLLSNALKFTTRGGTVRLHCWTESGAVFFEVTDSGIGIPVDELDRVFDSFYQVDGSTTRHYGGTGLGLTISRRLAELMDGTLELTSEGAELGTTARLVLQEYSDQDGSS